MTPTRRTVLLLCALLGSGCPPGDKGSASDGASSTAPASSTTGASDSTTGAGTGSSGAATSSTTATTGGPDVDCSVKPAIFPVFDKSCTTVDDCVIVFHTDCCGPQAIGLNKAEEPAFAAAEALCGPQCPPLGCDHPTMAEDGDVAPQDSDVQVECAAGKCMTFVP